MKLAVLVGILVCSGLLGFGQANLQAARELASKGSFDKADAILPPGYRNRSEQR
jgi:hypothetical protein